MTRLFKDSAALRIFTLLMFIIYTVHRARGNGTLQVLHDNDDDDDESKMRF